MLVAAAQKHRLAMNQPSIVTAKILTVLLPPVTSVKTLVLTTRTSFVAYYSLIVVVADDCVIVAFCARADIADAEQ